MNTPLNTPNDTIVMIVSFSLSQQTIVSAVIIRIETYVNVVKSMLQDI